MTGRPNKDSVLAVVALGVFMATLDTSIVTARVIGQSLGIAVTAAVVSFLRGGGRGDVPRSNVGKGAWNLPLRSQEASAMNDPSKATANERQTLTSANERAASGRTDNGGSARGLARGLAWLSVGLGATAVLAPGVTARLVGASSSRAARTTVMAVGLRELSAGAGLFASTRKRAAFTWFRVAGDLMDLALLVSTMRSRERALVRRAAAVAFVSGVTLVDIAAAAAQTE